VCGILGMEIGDKEHRCNNQHTSKHSQNDADSLTSTHLFKGWNTMTTTDDDKQGEDASCQGVVNRDESKGPFHGICPRVHQKLNSQENHSAKASCDGRSNTPRRRNL